MMPDRNTRPTHNRAVFSNLKPLSVMMAPPFVKGFKQNNSDCGVFKGAEISDEKSDSTLNMENRFRAAGIGASE
jgi:hypothetical protein